MKYLADEFYLLGGEADNAAIAAVCRERTFQKQKPNQHLKEKGGMKIDQSTASGSSR